MALASGLLAFLAIVICRKRQGYTLPHYPSLLCVEHFLTLFLCLCVMLPVIQTQNALRPSPKAFFKMSDTKMILEKQRRIKLKSCLRS